VSFLSVCKLIQRVLTDSLSLCRLAIVLVARSPNLVNVGFSYSDSGKDVQDTPSSAADVDAFLRLFFAKYTKFAKNEFHVFGESYAGHYIPAIGDQILKENEGAKVKINLKSLGIGNGLVDPLNQ